MKRILSFAIALMMVLSMVPAMAEGVEYIAAPYTVAEGAKITDTYLTPVVYENEGGPSIGVTLVGVLKVDGKYFKDANATTEYKNGDKDVILPRTDHVDENKDGKCDFCKCDLATEPTEATQPDDTETDSKQDKKPSSKKDRNDDDDEDEESIF